MLTDYAVSLTFSHEKLRLLHCIRPKLGSAKKEFKAQEVWYPKHMHVSTTYR
jgi:hypothetical protein